ncbi:adenylyl cyclase X E-like [Musca vetustissima]|uniref:adenylyl cyclase X E-like n=1 Tax=Musca vetustissima TaxID=27455 RepID=UPI002AB69C38|nr:adenylyl cyclase X E-like [Musca vetustissima]
MACLCSSIYLKKDFVNQHSYIQYLVSWLISLIMSLTDFMIGILAYTLNDDILRPCYCGYTISCIYLFMPIPRVLPQMLLAFAISVLYGLCSTFAAFTKSTENENMNVDLRTLLPDLIFIIGLNVIGLCNRIRRDCAARRVLLTRHLNVQENFLLKFAKDQEHSLLISIIPAQIAEKIGQEIKTRIELLKNPKIPNSIYYIRKLFIESHYNVSIIFADLVNYTHLTTTLDIKTLVETLHDLFQRFDQACQEFNVMRIKFLGDCYYGVTGMPQAHPFHAHCCIEFGRAIIEQISDVRNVRNLDIDMRIGVHSGNILSGIIGAAKWQYDIWSKDVDIASHLEQTGVAGRVHISKNVLKYVEAYYEYEAGTESATRDPLLIREHIKTYLIIKPSEFMTQSKEWKTYKNRIKTKRKPHTFADAKYTDVSKPLDYNSIKSQANLQMSGDIRKLPIYKLGIKEHLFVRMPRLDAYEMEDFTANRNISTFCLWFSDWNWESVYNSEFDEFFKISIAMSYAILICIMIMQGSNEIIHNVQSFIILYTVIFLYTSVILILVWLRPMMTKCSSNNRQRKLMFCDPVALENDDDLMHEFLQGGHRTLCFNSWAITECIVLCMAMIFTFSHIPYCIQMVAGFAITTYYMLIIFIEFDLVYECSLVTNKTIRAEASHVWNILTVLMIYQLMSRHVVYVSKIEAISKWRLEKKQENARVTEESIRILLHNILPTHVVNIYLSNRLRNEPYYEQHEYVAVMFATIVYARSGSIELKLLNEIICDFDEVLGYYKTPIKVEKIKVANWSYMAACGFDIPFGDTVNTGAGLPFKSMFLLNKRPYTTSLSGGHVPRPSGSKQRIENKEMAENRSSETDSDENSNNSTWQKRQVVMTMTQFALDLLASMHSFNVANQLERGSEEPPIMLRIGISSGEVMAGVVGSSQAHYDIWGNAVNMASRMDSTGEVGCIQITEEIAEALKSFNINCKYRGMTEVKGRGKIPTYFITITDKFEFEYFKDNEKLHQD